METDKQEIIQSLDYVMYLINNKTTFSSTDRIEIYQRIKLVKEYIQVESTK